MAVWEWTEEPGWVYLARLDQLGVLNPETGEREGAEYQRLRLASGCRPRAVIYRGYGRRPADGT